MVHEQIQSYFEAIYQPFNAEIKQSMVAHANETYGELYYYSVVKLLKYIDITNCDHFLDIGSGLGRLVFQIFLTTPVCSVTGIEINPHRHRIANQIKNILRELWPAPFQNNRQLSLIENDFLKQDLSNISIVYLCSTVFSFELLDAIGKKVNTMKAVRTVISLRKLPNLGDFSLTKKIFLHGTWDQVNCYIYNRKNP